MLPSGRHSNRLRQEIGHQMLTWNVGHLPSTPLDPEGDESGWRAWECLSELAMVCCGDCGLLQPRHPHQVPAENPRDLRGCGVVMGSVQAVVEGTLDLVASVVALWSMWTTIGTDELAGYGRAPIALGTRLKSGTPWR